MRYGVAELLRVRGPESRPPRVAPHGDHVRSSRPFRRGILARLCHQTNGKEGLEERRGRGRCDSSTAQPSTVSSGGEERRDGTGEGATQVLRDLQLPHQVFFGESSGESSKGMRGMRPFIGSGLL